MTLITSSEDVRAPAPFSAAYLNDYLKRLQGPDALVRLNLHVPLAEIGVSGGVLLDRRVVAGISQAPHVSGNGAQGRAIAITWEAEGGGPFPTFSGTLAVVLSSVSEESTLVISGSYRPPGGIVGDVFDGAIGSKIARATAKDLLRQLRDGIEAEYSVRQQMA
jgi:hypothetical protein